MSYVRQLIIAADDIDELEDHAAADGAKLEPVSEDSFKKTVNVVAPTKLQVKRVIAHYVGDSVLAETMFGDIRYRNY